MEIGQIAHLGWRLHGLFARIINGVGSSLESVEVQKAPVSTVQLNHVAIDGDKFLIVNIFCWLILRLTTYCFLLLVVSLERTRHSRETWKNFQTINEQKILNRD